MDKKTVLRHIESPTFEWDSLALCNFFEELSDEQNKKLMEFLYEKRLELMIEVEEFIEKELDNE